MRERGTAAAAKWQGLISEQEGSGKSVAEFCRERAILASQMFSWKKRLREAEAAQFVEVAVKPSGERSEPRGTAIEVRLAGGRRILVEPGFGAHHLRALLSVLEVEA